jgi:D-alanyl-D-alanine dipeptidase
MRKTTFPIIPLLIGLIAVSVACSNQPQPNKSIQETNMLKRAITSREARLSIALKDNGSPMVKANKYSSTIVMKPGMPDMKDITGEDIYVREEVAKMLGKANEKLQAAGLNLIVGYGYRAPSIQEKYWKESIDKVKKEYPNWSQDQIENMADTYAADPKVAGHITGGCVDVTIGQGDKPLDMGVALDNIKADAKLIKTFGDNITPEQMANRMALYQVMTEVGFMPFFGEYWHFMYGDREWAHFSGLKESLYAPIEFKAP